MVGCQIDIAEFNCCNWQLSNIAQSPTWANHRLAVTNLEVSEHYHMTEVERDSHCKNPSHYLQ